MQQSFVYNGDSDIYLLGLADTRTGLPVTSATVTATIIDPNGATVGTVTLDSINAGGSSTVYNYPRIGVNTVSAGGNYRGQASASLGLVVGTKYTLKVVGTVSANQFCDVQTVPCKNYAV